jgi:hypothetical protein
MKEFCENPNCETPGFKEVPVSVNKPSDQKRTLCATCEEAYTWGVQHGSISSRMKEVWLVAVADRGIVAHVYAYPDAKAAIKELAAYLAENNGYAGPKDIRAIRRWLHRHDENLSVEITCQRWDKGAAAGARCTSKPRRGLVIPPPPHDRGEEPLYRVVYQIDVNARDMREAAESVHRILTDPDSMPPVLEVSDHQGHTTAIDLSRD